MVSSFSKKLNDSVPKADYQRFNPLILAVRILTAKVTWVHPSLPWLSLVYVPSSELWLKQASTQQFSLGFNSDGDLDLFLIHPAQE